MEGKAGSEQRAALEDGIVSEAEYLAAFDRYHACLKDGGYELDFVERRGPFMNFGIPNAAVQSGVDEECYAREWFLIDVQWQDMHVDVSEHVLARNYCLESAGHPVGSTAEETDRLFAEAGLDDESCAQLWIDDGMVWSGG